jgi:hypothetical protein
MEVITRRIWFLRLPFGRLKIDSGQVRRAHGGAEAALAARCEVADPEDEEDPTGTGVISGVEMAPIGGGGRPAWTRTMMWQLALLNLDGCIGLSNASTCTWCSSARMSFHNSKFASKLGLSRSSTDNAS